MEDLNDNKPLDGWMDNVSTPQALPGGKGTIATIQAPVEVETRFGKRYKCQVVIDGSDGSTINVGLFLPMQFPILHPKSTLAKILHRYSCNNLRELIGKEVEVIEVGDMLWKIRSDDE